MDLSSSTGVFADQLFKQIASTSEANILISPVGIFTILSMLLAGSRTKTRHQLINVMHLPANVTTDSLDNSLAQLIRAYESIATSPNQLTLSNSMLVSKGRVCGRRGILQEYEDIVTGKYEATLRRVNFRKNGPAIQHSLNKWINQTTNGLIPNALSSPPSADTYLLLINVIYFNYQWLTRFNPSTVNKFYLNKETSVDAQFMTLQGSLRYLRTSCKSDSQLQLLQIPYKGDFSMIVILPSINSTLEEVLQRESLSNLATMLLKKGRSRAVQLHMLKFKFDTRLSLVQPLEQLGVPNLFERPVDLSGINGEKNLKVSTVSHVTAIDVNELGTRAAAVTSVGIRAQAISVPRKPKVITVNRPFAFFIYDTTHNLPLFLGRLVKP